MKKDTRQNKLSELRNKLKNAVFVEIIVIFIALGAFLGIGYNAFYHKFIKPNLYTIIFNDIDGLIEGSPVRFMGVMAGHVRRLTYHKDSIEVQIIVTKKGLKLPPGSIAAVEFTGIAGSKSIEIMPPKSNLSDVGIVAKDTLRITDVLDEYMYIGKVFSSLKEFVDGINQDTVLKVFSAVSKTAADVKNANKTVEERKMIHAKLNKRVENIIINEKKLEATVDRANETAKNLGSYFKK